MLTVQGLPVGTYEAVLETVDEAPDAEQAQQAKPRSVSVRRGGRPTRTIFNIRAQQRQRGDLLIQVRDQDGSYLAGACFGLIPNGETAPSAEVCDNRGDDENSADGRILLTNIRAGRYTLTQTTAPTGYSTAADQSVRIAAGSVREVAVTNQAEPERTANLDVETTDGEERCCPRPATRSCEAIRRSKPATMMTTESPGSPVFHPAATSCARSSRQRVATPQQAPRPRVSTLVSRRR